MSDGADLTTGLETGDPVEIRRKNLLLVEGRDEVFFFGALLRHLERDDVQVLEYKGKGNLRSTLKALRNQGGWRALLSIVVVRDADYAKEGARETAAQSVWKSVTGTLVQCGVRAPAEHGRLSASELEHSGVPVSPAPAGPSRAAVFVAPDGVRDGMLEDLCMLAVAEDAAMPCLDAYFACLREKGIQMAAHRLPKARAHAFLASRDEPDTRVGEAAKKGYWPWDAPAFAPLVELIRSLPVGASESFVGPADGGRVTSR